MTNIRYDDEEQLVLMDQNKSVTKKQLLVGNFMVSSDLVA